MLCSPVFRSSPIERFAEGGITKGSGLSEGSHWLSMAFVRLVCFPCTSQFPAQQLLSFSQTAPKPPPQVSNTLYPPLSSLSLSASPFPLSYTLPIKTQKLNPFHFTASTSSIQPQATIESPEVEESEIVVDEQQVLNEEEDDDEASRTRVLAQNLPWTSTVDEIRSLFEKYGTVVDIELSMHNKTRNRGLAFVTMGSPEEARAALNNLEAHEFEGRALKLNWARPRAKKPFPAMHRKQVPIHNLYVANLSYQARAKDLEEFFKSENGNAVSAEIIFHDNPRRSAGYGFVSFNSKDAAEAALSAFQGKEFMGRRIRVAHSKRFLRQAKANDEPENESIKLSPNSEQSEADEA